MILTAQHTPAIAEAAPCTRDIGDGWATVRAAHEQWVARTGWPRLPLTDEDRKWPERLRHQSRGLLMKWGLEFLSDRVETVLTELVTNALVHGGGDSIGFRLTLTEGGLLIEVADSSPGMARVVHAGPDAESGRGLLLVEVVADDWGVSPRRHADGKWTWAAFNTASEGSC
ncbi:ATP-binding protein [Streptomyces sp. MBT27]|uniref:ATP-binding protein n=1 Tax=Streptomyces sp. MBT27 TaxID=1488356 RepID=UPI00141FE5DD|nr:ATP-binding protein [Streptomyces sp. MBT27]